MLGDTGFETAAGASFCEDRAFTHGLGVFETMLALDGELVAWDLHFARLREGCHRLMIRVAEERRLRGAVEDLLDEVGGERLRLRLMLTGGRGGLRSLAGERSLVVLSISPVVDPPPALRVVLSPWPVNEASPLAGIKCTSYAANLIALDDARQEGADEVVFTNTREELCEAAAANLFLVRGGTLVTPELDSGCLPGTARERILRLAKPLGIEALERRVDAHELALAEESFLSSATGGVMPIGELDGMAMPAPGPLTARLRDAFERSLRGL